MRPIMIWNIDGSELESITYEKHMESNSRAHFIGDRMNLFELKRDFVLKTWRNANSLDWNYE